ncbi:DUF397 domain-containing protein [Spirillospora albida]|uniref:DUF397 domain-containing protein n=1 Tax=Spirillospora albida TaxID=58123 RepID=UPI0004C0E11E|nr:DUF397 domain-containing protein [Spirillospora albida]
MTAQLTRWRKARFSEADGACVEIARFADGMIGVRDSKAGDRSPILNLTPNQWTEFLHVIRSS